MHAKNSLELDILQMYTILFIRNTIFDIYKGIESLPYDLQRNFSLQRDLDQRAHGKFSFHII